jgi:hypothetical protein
LIKGPEFFKPASEIKLNYFMQLTAVFDVPLENGKGSKKKKLKAVIFN